MPPRQLPALFSPRKQTALDWLSGTIVITDH
jgi:hypothetical protein